MFSHAAMSRAACTVLAFSCFLAAGCAGVRRAQQTEPVPVSPAAASIPVAEAAPAVAETPEVQATPAPPPAIQPERRVEPAPAVRVPVPKAPATVAPATTVAPPKAPLPKPAPAIASVPTPTPQVMPKAAAVPAEPQPAPAPLDFKSLATRLRQTKAIGVMTKLALKNQVDDLVDNFRAYHKRQGTATLAELRRNYDMLLLKVLSLLQDSDPPLARDIVKSRAAIWSILEDPKKFTESNLMAGATP
jgi:hypothetical protein